MKTIGICSDHAGYELKKTLIPYLEGKGFEVQDYGTDSSDSCDYPDYAHPMAYAIDEGKIVRGISICGSGNGITMTVNKHPKVRAALSWAVELAVLGRQHNDANVCGIPARFVSQTEAIAIVDAFLDTPFDGGRHQARIEKIPLQ